MTLKHALSLALLLVVPSLATAYESEAGDPPIGWPLVANSTDLGRPR